MSFQKKIFRLTWYSFIYLFVTLAVLAAVTLTLARMWLPSATQYKSDIEQWVGQILEQQVVIDSMDADWYALEPQLVLEGVQFLSKDGKSIISDFSRIKVGVDVIASILRQAPVPGALVIEGARIVLVRQLDGSFSVSGFGSQKGVDDSSSEASRILEQWLLDQRLLKIQNSSLVWRDRQSQDEARLFSDVNLTLRNDGARHQIEGSVFLPQDLGSHVLFFLDLRGNVFSSNDWSGSAQVTGVGLHLENWLTETTFQNIELGEGLVSFSSWSRLQGAQVTEIRGEVLASNLQLRSLTSRRLSKIDSLSSDFSIEHQNDNWNISADGLSLVHKGNAWKKMRIDARFKQAKKILEAEVSQISIENVVQLLSISDSLKGGADDYVRTANPQGELENLTAFAHLGDDSALQFAAGGRFRNIESGNWKKLPGIGPLSGEFEISNSDGYVWFDSEEWALDYASMFKDERYFTRLNGSVSWNRKTESAWELIGRNLTITDEDFQARGGMRLLLEEGQSPFLDLSVSIKASDITSTRKYLPDAIMKDSLVDWIDTSLENVNIKAGGMVYYGHLDRYPFVENDGRFHLSLSLDDTRLRYLKDWPVIDNINGVFDLSSTGLDFTSNSATVYSNKIDAVSVSIPEFGADRPFVAIAGNLVGSTADKFRYMYDSPLNDLFAKNLKLFEVSGDSELAIGLDIPLRAGDELFVSGSLTTSDNRLFASEAKLDLNKINGTLLFDQNGIYGEALTLNLGPLAIETDVDSIDIGEGREIVFSHKGKISHDDFSYIFKEYVKQPHWKDIVSGEIDADVHLFIPMREGGAHQKITLLAQSDLQGVGIDLPIPLGKTKDEIRPFDINVELSGERRDLALTLGEASMLMQLESTAGEVKVERGAVGLGVTPTLPSENGFHFLGKIDRFFWSEWGPMFIPEEGKHSLFEGGGGAGSVYFDVAINKAEVLGAEFDGLRLQASNTAQGWTMHAQGPAVNGSVYLPIIWDSAPLVLDMQKLHIKLAEKSDNEKQIDPNLLPQIRFSSDDFAFNDMVFGKTSFSSEKVPDGVRLNSFVSKSKLSDFNVGGTWLFKDDKHSSDFVIKMVTREFGKNMRSWGYQGVVEKGDGALDIDATWQGSPVDFALSTLKGKVDINMNNIRLLDLNVGVAKMLGLLSLEAIPRRLFFDFRDVVKKGMVFDSVLGQFDIQAGDAFSSGLLMTGPSGRMGLAGRVGLDEKDYDLVVTFVPKAFDSLPVLGGIASTGVGTAPAVTLGATIYVMQKLFQSQMDELSTVQYTIGGSWKEPVVTQVKTAAKTPVETEFVDEQ